MGVIGGRGLFVALDEPAGEFRTARVSGPGRADVGVSLKHVERIAPAFGWGRCAEFAPPARRQFLQKHFQGAMPNREAGRGLAAVMEQGRDQQVALVMSSLHQPVVHAQTVDPVCLAHALEEGQGVGRE